MEKIRHFYDGELSSTLRVSQQEPEIKESGYPDKGAIWVNIGDGDEEMSIKLNNGEALRIARELQRITDKNSEKTDKLWAERGKKQRKKKSKSTSRKKEKKKGDEDFPEYVPGRDELNYLMEEYDISKKGAVSMYQNEEYREEASENA